MMSEHKRIVMIGPVYPYKGGIAHYTALMYRALAKKSHVIMVSYKLQYPKFLFRQDQKAFGNDGFKIVDTNYLINTANPFNWFFTGQKINRMHPDLVIVQWWHPYFAPCYWSILRSIKNCRILFVCHNVFPHERFPLDVFLTSRVLKLGDCFIVQSKQDEKALKSIKADAVYQRVVHPTYNIFKIHGLTMTESRKQLNIADDAKVLLFFGFVREYKGLKYLLRALPDIIHHLSNVYLLVVGQFSSNKEEYLMLIEKLGIQSAVKIYDRYVPDKEVEVYFAASDLVVLPYESATQSGIVQIAYGFEKPVVATSVGGLPEAVIDGRTGYLTEPKNSLGLSKSIIRFFKEDKAVEFEKEICREADKYSWDKMAETVFQLEERCHI